MVAPLEEFLVKPESERFDRKSQMNLGDRADMLALVGDLVAMANTHGGQVLVGTLGSPISEPHLRLFDSARVDDKVNSFVEPPVCGIKSFVFSEEFVVIEVAKSEDPPHVFKKDGNYEDARGPKSVFRRSDVFARHSSKSERANRQDFDRWLEERREKLFRHVKMVFEASPTARLQLTEGGGGVPFRIDASAPDARPVYDLITTEPFRDVSQELAAGVKAWKSSRHLLSELQVYKAYKGRDEAADHEVIELVLRSCWAHYLNGYYWAAKMVATRLVEVLDETIKSDQAPASTEALYVGALLPRQQVRGLFEAAKQSSKKTPRKRARKLEPVIAAHKEKAEALAGVVTTQKNLIYVVDETRVEVPHSFVTAQVFDEILETLMRGARANKAALRLSELLVWGQGVTSLQFPPAGGADVAS
jgi:hypothetical protein